MTTPSPLLASVNVPLERQMMQHLDSRRLRHGSMPPAMCCCFSSTPPAAAQPLTPAISCSLPRLFSILQLQRQVSPMTSAAHGEAIHQFPYPFDSKLPALASAPTSAASACCSKRRRRQRNATRASVVELPTCDTHADKRTSLCSSNSSWIASAPQRTSDSFP